MENDSELRDRWKTDNGHRVLSLIIESAKNGEHDWEKHLAGFPCREENKKDLRFAPIADYPFDKTREGALRLEGVDFSYADLFRANLNGVILFRANFTNSNLTRAGLVKSKMQNSNLEKAVLSHANLIGCKVKYACVQESQLDFLNIDKETDFRGVALDLAWIDSKTKSMLQYNIRRLNWNDWYDSTRALWRILGKLFWSISDYGSSAGRIVVTFSLLVFLFAGIYFMEPDMLDGLAEVHCKNCVEANDMESSDLVVQLKLGLRALYFSVVTMTTLGFGDIYACPNSFWGHFILMVQVMLGYILLGALITRLAILFQSEGPNFIPPQ